ncbi:Ger(x)C family spore germination protein [Brevibacillus sp. GCM10020057]|uniref:Ger(x)C family spore germination protein n=1 Tax=Brevibacillus sp. GCM10020057 TaxID=3317327 RepID=UPI003636782F
MKARCHLAILLCSLILCGCWDRIEVNDVAIVTAAAIDKAEDQELELSIQVFIPRALGGGGLQGTGMKSLTIVRSARGVTIADAMSKIQMKIPRLIFWGHCKVYIYGEEIAKKGIADLVDYLARHPQPRNRAFMYVSKGRAVDVLLSNPKLERDSAETIRELSGLHVGMEVTLIELMKMLKSPSKAAILPIIDLVPTPGSSQQTSRTPNLFGSAIFKEGKMIGQLSERATRGVMWVRNEIDSTTVTVKAKKGKGFVSLLPIREVTELVPSIEKGKWKMTVKAESEGFLIQNGTNLNLSNPDLLHLMQVALRKDIEARMRGTFHLLQHDMKTDVFGFATAFRRKYPKEFAQVKDRWDEVFPTIDVDLQITSYIRRPGLINIPGGIPGAEVRQK